MAPELLFAPNDGYDYKVDVWALGALFYTMLTGKHAFYAPTKEALLQKQVKGDWVWPKDV